MFRRYFLFLLTNILVVITTVITVNIIMSLFGIQLGDSYQSLMIFCFIWGMVGSFISLRLSKWIAIRTMSLKKIEAGGQYSHIYSKVANIAKVAKLPKMPDVYIFASNDPNAFATGHSKSSSLVAVSTGLLEKMNDEEVEAVLAHEVAHIANGDMITMALVQGVVNSFVMFFSYIVTNIITNFLRGDDDEFSMGDFFLHHFVYSLVHTVFAILAAPIVMFVSRQREYRADYGSAKFVGVNKMIAALEALKRHYPYLKPTKDNSLKVMGISSKGSFLELFSSHPTLDKRIKALTSNSH